MFIESVLVVASDQDAEWRLSEKGKTYINSDARYHLYKFWHEGDSQKLFRVS